MLSFKVHVWFYYLYDDAILTTLFDHAGFIDVMGLLLLGLNIWNRWSLFTLELLQWVKR